MKKKSGYTIIEVLIASGLFAFIISLGMTIVALVSGTLYTGQIESKNRSSLNDIVFYITREIQSAESIKVENDGKKLSIKESGSDGYNLIYEIKEDYPTDTLCFKDKKLIDINYEESNFSVEENSVRVNLAIVKNSTDVNQMAKNIRLNITPRSEGMVLE